ncbi:MAG: hypothetical protein ABII96_07605, partial [Candidatus Zixiibacteriota bacterium]
MLRQKRDKLFLFLASWIGPILIYLMGMTLRTEWAGLENLDKLRKEKKSVIYAFWHGRMLIFAYIFSFRVLRFVAKPFPGWFAEQVGRISTHGPNKSAHGATSDLHPFPKMVTMIFVYLYVILR